MQQNFPKVYTLLMLLGLFPQGLAYQDLMELEVMNKIPMEWGKELSSFIEKKINHIQRFQEASESKNSQDIDEKSKPSQENSNKINFPLLTSIWFTISRDEVNDEILFIPSDLLRRYVEKLDNISEYYIWKAEYLAALSVTLLEQIMKKGDYQEKIYEFSAVSRYGVWKISEGNRVKYLDHRKFNVKRLKRRFEHHEPHFLSCFESNFVEAVKDIDNNKKSHFVEVFQVVVFIVLTLSKIIVVKQFDAEDLVNKAKKSLKFLGVEKDRRLIYKIKLRLFLIAFSLGNKFSTSENTSWINNELSNMSQRIENEGSINEISFEISFVQAYYYEKISDKKSEIIKEFLKKAQEQLSLTIKKDIRLNVLKAKIMLKQSKTWRKLHEISPEYLVAMEETLQALKSYKAPRLLMKAYYLSATLKIA